MEILSGPAMKRDHDITVKSFNDVAGVTSLLPELTSADVDAFVPDHHVIRLYYSILNPQRKQALDLQEKLRSASTESLYPFAVKVATHRTKSRPKTPFYEIRESPINTGETTPSVKYVYLTQTRPRPLVPLKAWKGYNGNLYFEPMTIQGFAASTPSTKPSSQLGGVCNSTSSQPRHPFQTTSSKSRQRNRFSWKDGTQQPAKRPEKEAAVSRLGLTTPSSWIDQGGKINKDDVGSLRISNSSPSDTNNRPAVSAGNKLKKPQLCRGSVVQQLRVKATERWTTPKLTPAYGYTCSTLSGGWGTTATPTATSMDSINTIGYQSTVGGQIPKGITCKMSALSASKTDLADKIKVGSSQTLDSLVIQNQYEAE